jgi:uncharacterized membrane protein
MRGESGDLEKRVDTLTRRVDELTRQVAQLSALAGRQAAPPAPPPRAPLPQEPGDVSEEVLSWAGEAALLPRLSTLCFLLVIALVLRTVTDHRLIDPFAGSVMGMGYAASLMAAAWILYGRKSRLAPVFAACGAVLMPVIVVETHGRFGSLASEPAYGLLVAAGITMALMSRRFDAFIPISFGTLGMCLAAAAIDFPRPFFPYPAIVLLIANLLGYLASGIKRCSWLRWILLAVSLVVLHLWSMALGIALTRGAAAPEALAPEWFLPVLGLFAVAYPSLAFFGFLRVGGRKFSRFVVFLPTVSALWLFFAARHVILARGAGTAVLGAVGVAAAAAYAAAAYLLSRRNLPGAPGTNSFIFAAAALLSAALPDAFGKPLFALPLISCSAFALAFLSKSWDSGGIRITSYLLQGWSCALLAFVLASDRTITFSVAGAAAAAALVGVSLLHYRWSRTSPPPEESEFFRSLDREDRSGALLLIASLAAGFFMVRVGLYQALALVPGGTGDLFRSAQTILVNLSATVLMLLALRRRNREMRNVAILVTVVGAVMVFLYDLIGIHGIPLVLSVLSFGLAAAVESTALGKWQRAKPPAETG